MMYYELDPCHFYTSPGLSFEACLKMTGVELELLTNIDMHLFIEEGLRGGVAMITKRYSKANNKKMNDYDEGKPSTYIIYYDMNNLYGHSMRQYMPQSNFRWLAEIDFNKCLEALDEGEEGYFVEVGLEYPADLHTLHNDYPLAPERKNVTDDMISLYSKNLLELAGLHQSKVSKLIPNLNDKVKYHLSQKFMLDVGAEQQSK